MESDRKKLTQISTLDSNSISDQEIDEAWLPVLNEYEIIKFID